MIAEVAGNPRGEGGSQSMSDRMFLDKDGVEVTDSRFVVHGTTYAMGNITSVRTQYFVKEAKRWIPGIVSFVAGLSVLGSFGPLFGGDFWMLILIPFWGAVLAGGIFWYREMEDEITHGLILTTPSGDITALLRHDEERIDEDYTALNDAMAARR